MNCEGLHVRLDAWLEGTLGDADRSSLEAHASTCDECRSVLTAVGGSADESIVSSVMARTTGRSCARVRDELAGIDPVPAAVDAHVAACADCSRFRAALVRCDHVLPELAESNPDADFASDVVMATVDRPSLVHVAWRRAVDRWNEWLDRPRAAQEIAYAVTLTLVLLTATPFAPFPHLPERARDLAGRPFSSSLFAAAGQRSADVVGVDGSSTRVLDDAQRRGRRILRDLDRVGEGLGATAVGFLAGDVERVERGARAVGCGFESLWLGVREPDVEPGPPCADVWPGTAMSVPTPRTGPMHGPGGRA